MLILYHILKDKLKFSAKKGLKIYNSESRAHPPRNVQMPSFRFKH